MNPETFRTLSASETITFSVADSGNKNVYGLELIFHESSHLLIWPDSFIGRSLLFQQIKHPRILDRKAAIRGHAAGIHIVVYYEQTRVSLLEQAKPQIE